MSSKKTVIDTPENEASAMETERIEQSEPETCHLVYCGPTIPGVAHSFTVYAGGEMPEALREFLRKHPAANALVVNITELPEKRRNVETPGTAEYILYRQIKNNL